MIPDGEMVGNRPPKAFRVHERTFARRRPGYATRRRRRCPGPCAVRDVVPAHLAAIDLAYTGVIEDLRRTIRDTETLVVVSHDLLIALTGGLELFQWFIRAHLEGRDGSLVHAGADSELGAADTARA